MRVVRVALENLNSLRGEHEVDFSAEPIAGAGLFAITGATGAGKTTLLDAITLALYGRAARYANLPNPEDMMSRHTGECRAEVDFEVAGGRYRAVWQLRRSRGLPGGKVQPVKRYLYDGSGAVLAGKVRDVDEQIEALSGLDYGRFMRSVLLAQGEFAKFLKAKPNERAGLLESLTGTEIFSELGRLTHEEAVRKGAELAGREVALEQLAVLDDGGRKKLEAEEGGILERLKKARARRSRYEVEVQRGARLRDAMEAAERVRDEEAKLAVRRNGMADDLAKLARHRKIEPLVPLLERIDEAEGRLKKAMSERAEGEKGTAEAEVGWRAALGAALEFALSELAESDRELDAVRAKIGEAERARRVALKWIDGHAEDVELSEKLPEIQERGAIWEHVRTSLELARKKLVGIGEEEDVGQRRLEAVTGEWEKAKEVAEGAGKYLEAKRAAVSKLLEGRSEESWRAEANQLFERKHALGRIRIFDGVKKAAIEKAGKAKRVQVEMHVRLARAEDGVKSAEAAWRSAGEVLETHRAHLETAKLAASFEDHRAHLQPGEACPLCGAEEHPYQKEGGLRPPLVREIEKRIASLRGRVEEAEKGRAEARDLVARLGEEMRGAKKAEAEAIEEARVAEERATELAEQAGTTEFSEEDFEAAGRKASTWEVKVRFIREAGEVVSAAEAREGKLVARVEQLNVDIAGKSEEVKKLRHNREKVIVEVRQMEKSCESAAGELEAVIRPFGFTFESGLFGAPEKGWKEALVSRARKFREEERALGEAEKKLGELQGRERELVLESEGMRRWRDSLLEKGAGERGKVDERWNWKNREEADKALERWEVMARGRRVTFEEKRKQEVEATERVKECEVELKREAEASGILDVGDVRSSRLGEEEAKRVALLEKRFEGEVQRIKGAGEVHAKVIESLRGEGAAEGAEFSKLRSLRASAEAEGDALQEALAGIRERLRRDSENRGRRKDLGEELKAGRKDLDIWKRLRGLIGSADGARFSRFAQGISLDVLAGHANAHLARLSDRYEARRVAGEELELEIVDQYQGGVCRPMTSLSGGESFLVSLALALGLSDLAGRNVRIDSLFIDEGFGALDAETLDIAISALDSLRMDQKTVGVISHIDLLKERIATQVVVEKGVGGVGKISVVNR